MNTKELKEWIERFKPYFYNMLSGAILRGENKITIETYYPYLKDSDSITEKHIHKMFKDFLEDLDYKIIEEETNDNKITISWE